MVTVTARVSCNRTTLKIMTFVTIFFIFKRNSILIRLGNGTWVKVSASGSGTIMRAFEIFGNLLHP